MHSMCNQMNALDYFRFTTSFIYIVWLKSPRNQEEPEEDGYTGVTVTPQQHS